MLFPTSAQYVAVVQSLSCVRLFVTPWTAARWASLSFIISHGLLTLMSIELVIPSNLLILCHCLSRLAFNLSQHQGLFHWVGSSHQEAKLLELQHQPFQWIFMGLVQLKALVSNCTTGRPSLKLRNLGSSSLLSLSLFASVSITLLCLSPYFY